MHIEINKRKLLWVLSSVVDLVGVTDLLHGKRVAYIADKIRDQLNEFSWNQDDVIVASLLHDCGVSSTDVHEHLIMEMEWEAADYHCKRGEKLLSSQPNLSHLAPAIGMHHKRWTSMSEGDDQILANLIFLADRIDVISATSHDDILVSRKSIIAKIKSLKGTLFSPILVDAFLEIADNEMFWLKWNESNFDHIMSDWIDKGCIENIEFEELHGLFTLFSSCVDGKSSFTYNHSIGVAELSKTVAELLELPEDNIQKLELAALLHDLGKLRIPDTILEKPGQLDNSENQRMRHHSYDTLSILCRITGFEEIAQWASQHHEKLNGKGYPEGIGDKNIGIESRILTIADIFQALAQDRPYRRGLPLSAIISILQEMVDKDEIDGTIVDLIVQNGEMCMESALRKAID